jgi:hypothetical protein
MPLAPTITVRLGWTGDDGCVQLIVYAYDPSHVTAVVPFHGGALTGSDGHGRAAHVKDEEADPGNVPSRQNRDCFVLL